jgi:hypothetical protein
MTLDEWFGKYNGQPMDYDGAYGNQCVDVFSFYIHDFGFQEISGVAAAYQLWDNAGDGYLKIENTPSAVPQKGDIIVWGTLIGAWGHVAIFHDGDVNSFTSFDQNWPMEGYTDANGNFIGTGVAHFQYHNNYFGVVGWLRPRALIPAPKPAPKPIPKPAPKPAPVAPKPVVPTITPPKPVIVVPAIPSAQLTPSWQTRLILFINKFLGIK